MKNKLIVIICLFFIKCTNKNTDQITISGKELSISFLTVKLNTIRENNYFTIDNIRYTHKSDFTKGIISKNVLPSIKNVILSVDGKNLIQEGNTISILNTLLDNLKNTNNYKFKDPEKNILTGRLIFKRKDNKKIIIKYSKNYPLNIQIIRD